MPKKKKTAGIDRESIGNNIKIENAGITIENSVVDTVRENYMPYVMSVIVSRALPEIDGFKPAHRKLLYTMYRMGVLTGQRIKSANVVGQTMQLNPHGDAAIYETLVRLARGNETLLHPYIDSKGNFGKAYSRDMAYAASRYTEVKLAEIAGELFADISKDTVDFMDNYDGSMKEPTLFPARFPTILVNNNLGIAVGVASNICSFNLAEVCETTVALLKNPDHDIATTLKAPDFSGGGELLYDSKVISEVYNTGRGSIRIRSRYTYVKENNCIEITQIPPTTSVEAIMDKISELVKVGRVREINDMRNETDLKGLRLTLDIKRGVDPDKLMQKLFKNSPLEDSYGCNFTVLIGGTAKLMGVGEILDEWIAFRRECVRRRTCYDFNIKNDRLHILEGLEKILLDIDKAVRIVRETEEEKEVVPNLMIGFGIDVVQAEYIAEIKLRHLNREYILNRTNEMGKLREELADLNDILSHRSRIDRIIILEQAEIAKKYAQPRKTRIVYDTSLSDNEEVEEELPDYPVNVFFTSEGYLKKITPQSLRMGNTHKLKEGDSIVFHAECTNNCSVLVFSDRQQVYKAHLYDFNDIKASSIGDYAPAILKMDENERAVSIVIHDGYNGHIIFFYENGKAAKVPMSSFETKLNRKKLTGAYSASSILISVFYAREDTEYAVFTTAGRLLLINSALIPEKQKRDTQGVNVVSLKKNAHINRIVSLSDLELASPSRYRTSNLPAAGAVLRDDDISEQLSLE